MLSYFEVNTSESSHQSSNRYFFLFVGMLVLMLAVAIQWINLRREAELRHDWAEEDRYNLHLRCDPSEDSIRWFVESRLGQDTKSLSIFAFGEADLLSFSHLKQLRSLTYLTLSNRHPLIVGTGGTDLCLFAPVLTDEAVRELSQIKTLRLITIWYGSFSEAQKCILRRAIPECIIEENLNKM